jgi:adenosylmethionine---8-amino-7-oxononanoate aminotransferase
MSCPKQDHTERLVGIDRCHVWHPFTAMDGWLDPAEEPLVLERGEGVWLWDTRGRRYLDGNSSIWTNIHGHGHPKITAALRAQLGRVAHTSFLGFANPPAAELAARLCGFFPAATLERVFYTDNGSTAIEAALKMAIQFRQQNGEPGRTGFAAFANAYHGDTMGASSLGGVAAFFERFAAFGFRPMRAASLADLEALPAEAVRNLSAVIIEPLIQGVNRMALWPPGLLRDLRAWCDRHDVFLILDEVMTGFGRTGTMFACQQENVVPDFLCLAKGLTGGTLPLAATLVTGRIFDGFRASAAYPGDRTFYYGHSYCGNQLGCAAALASLDVFEEENTLARLPAKSAALAAGLAGLRGRFPRWIAATRTLGLIGALDLACDGEAWPAERKTGARVCRAARDSGLLTRPVLDTLVVMPPLCIKPGEIDFLLDALGQALAACFPPR